MRFLKPSIVSVLIVVNGIVPGMAQDPVATLTQTTAQDRVANLRSRLTEVEAKQVELQTRLQQLEENLKAEKVEHSLAGVGSTRPEDLREQRRRQLEIERNGVRAQLDLLAVSHSRLDTAIAQAEADAYRQSATPVIPTPPAAIGASTTGRSADSSNEAIVAPARRRSLRKKKTKKHKRSHHTVTSSELR